MKKRFLLTVMLILVLTASLMLLPDMTLNRFGFDVSAAEMSPEDMFTYTVTDGKVTITGLYEKASADLVIPSKLNDIPVSAIGESAFKSNKDIVNLTISEGIKEIEKEAFMGCSSLKSVIFPQSLEVVGGYAFSACSSLCGEITFSENVIDIGSGAFFGCYMVEKCTVLNPNCELHRDTVIPSLPGSGMIYGYYNSTAQSYARRKSYSFSFLDGDPNTIFNYYISSNRVIITGTKEPFSGDLVIPGGIGGLPVAVISDDAFMENNNLTSVVISEGVKEIGKRAFMKCSSLTSATLPQTLEVIGEQAFFNDTSLTGKIVIAKGVKEIPEMAFMTCGITELVLSDGVEKIGDRAFCDCDSIDEVIIPESVKEIGDMAFSICDFLRKVYIGNDDCIIYESDSLNSAVFPRKATLYAHNNSTAQAHAQKYGLEFVAVDFELEDAQSLLRYTVNSNNEITITGKREKFEGELIIPSLIEGLPVVYIADKAFEYDTDITAVTISNGVRYIGSSAFGGCRNIKTVKLPETMDIVFNAAFENCSSLEEINIPKNLKKIGVRAFDGCDSLLSVTFPGNDCVLLEDEDFITTADKFLFSDNTVIYGHEFSTAHSYAEACRKNFVSFESIYAAAFEVDFSDGILFVTRKGIVPDLEDLQFYPWSSYNMETKAIYFNNISVIERGWFAGFENLTTIVFETTVTGIINGAFSGCNSLGTVVSFDVLVAERDAFGNPERLKFFSQKGKAFNVKAYEHYTFAFDKNAVSFSGDVALSSYELFDLIAVMCGKFDNVDIIKFDKFTATDFKFYYFYEDDWRFEECKDNTLEEAEFTVKVNINGEMQTVSFNTLCDMVANGETIFTLVAKDKTQTEIKDTDIEVKEEESFWDRALAWITTLINKLLSIFSRFGK